MPPPAGRGSCVGSELPRARPAPPLAAARFDPKVIMASLNQWIAGARPRTLPAAVAPVLVGTGAAAGEDNLVVGYAVLALVIALALQVGVNYANDYSDGVRGTDAERVGPTRLVGQGLADPAEVKLLAWLCFGFAAFLGLALVALSGTWLMLPIGAAAIAAAWYYTGGDRPYGYLGFGEAFVFVFFGLVATLGTMATMTPPTAAAWVAACGVGFLAAALLVVNNLRDIPTDAAAGKRTLAVRLGDRGTRALYVLLVAGAGACAVAASSWRPWALLALLAYPLILKPVWQVWRQVPVGAALVPILGRTGTFQAVYAIGLAIGLSR